MSKGRDKHKHNNKKLNKKMSALFVSDNLKSKKNAERQSVITYFTKTVLMNGLLKVVVARYVEKTIKLVNY